MITTLLATGKSIFSKEFIINISSLLLFGVLLGLLGLLVLRVVGHEVTPFGTNQHHQLGNRDLDRTKILHSYQQCSVADTEYYVVTLNSDIYTTTDIVVPLYYSKVSIFLWHFWTPSNFFPGSRSPLDVSLINKYYITDGQTSNEFKKKQLRNLFLKIQYLGILGLDPLSVRLLEQLVCGQVTARHHHFNFGRQIQTNKLGQLE